MNSQKLVVTHRGRLVAKYGAAGLAAIDAAVQALAQADAARGMTTYYVHLDDDAEMKALHSKAVPKKPSASGCKAAIDKIYAAISPDYLLIIGSGDVVPLFVAPNPSFAPNGDTDQEVPTDNPYASSRPFKVSDRASYLVPDRVVGRIPDFPGSNDPNWLVNALATSTAWQTLQPADLGVDLMVVCDEWKAAGVDCVTNLHRDAANLLISPPTIDKGADLTPRYPARFQMIKCHGAPLDPHFYGQSGGNYPAVIFSESLFNQTSAGTVVGAMCCYGAAVYDPTNPAAVVPNAPAIPNVYLAQGASAYFGSTTIAWVGLQKMMCDDILVTSCLRAVMAGSSAGSALLEAKQDYLKSINAGGGNPNAADEKTLLQFMLLGDPSLHVVAPPAQAPAMMGMAAAAAPVAMAMERRARREFQFENAQQLRERVPTRKVVGDGNADAVLAAAANNLKETMDIDVKQFGAAVVHQVGRSVRQPELKRKKGVVAPAAMAGMAMAGPENASPEPQREVQEETLQYYWFARKAHERIIDATMMSVETDLDGNIVRQKLLVSS